MLHVIIKGKNKYGRKRSEIEENLRKDGLVSLTDEQLDRCKHLEREVERQSGSKESFVNQRQIDVLTRLRRKK